MDKLELERQRFEAWASKKRWELVPNDDGYLNLGVHQAWLGWQAAINSRAESRQTEMKDALRLLKWASDEFDKHKISSNAWYSEYENFLHYDVVTDKRQTEMKDYEPQVGDEYIFPKYSKGPYRYIKGYSHAWFHKKKYHGCQLHGDRIGDLYCFAPLPGKDAYPNIERLVRDGQSVTEVLGLPVNGQSLLRQYQKLREAVGALMTQSKEALKVIDEDYEEGEMSVGYPNPDSLSIAINDVESALKETV